MRSGEWPSDDLKKTNYFTKLFKEIYILFYFAHLSQLSKKYGSVFTVYMGSRKMVVLTGYKTIKEAFVGYADEFGEREAPRMTKEVNQQHGK